MSTIPASPAPIPAPVERRAHPRKRLDQLAYIGFGADTGGVLLDISEEGLRCQIVGAVVEGDRCHLKFALPGLHSPIEADGQVVWSNRSGQGGGIRLVSFASDARGEFQQWLLDAIASGSEPTPSSVLRGRSVGAVHVPPASAPAVHEAGANIPPAQPMAAASQQAALEPRNVAEDAGPGKVAPEAVIETVIDTSTKVTAKKEQALPNATSAEIKVEPAVTAKTAEPVPAATEYAATVAVAHRSAAQASEPRPAHIRAPGRPMSLAYSKPAPEKGRPTWVFALAVCVVGIVTLALSGFNPAILFPGNSMAAEISAPIVTPPAPPEMTELRPPAASPQPSVSTAASDASEVPTLSRTTPAPRIARPQPPAPKATAPSRPVQNSTPARPVNRERFSLAAPRPRTTSPAPPATAAPQMPPMVSSTPPPLIDMPALESRTPQLPQPGAGYRPPQLLSQVEPVYSAFARQARMQGTVRVNAKIGIDGVPRSLVCVAGNTVLCQMAFEAIGKWRYEPAAADGRPVEAQVLISFNFQLR